MVKYYYDKYAMTLKNTWSLVGEAKDSNPLWGTRLVIGRWIETKNLNYIYPGFDINSLTISGLNINSDMTLSNVPTHPNVTIFEQEYACVYFKIDSIFYKFGVLTSDSSYTKLSKVVSVEEKGLLQGSVIAEDGTYPVNGKHTDGFWYVRKGLANSAPTVSTIPAQSTVRGTNKTVALSNYFSDVDGDALTYSASSNAVSVATVAVSGSILTITPAGLGSATITVTASDGKDGTVSTNFTVTVTNQAPIGTTIPNQSGTKAVPVSLNVAPYFSDADGDALTFTASSSDAGIAVATISGTTLSITSKALGTATITVTANDGKGGTKASSFMFTVVNAPPAVNLDTSDSQTLYENSAFIINGSTVDTDNGDVVSVKYQINALPAKAITVNISDGVSALPFNRQLTFKNSKLFDGDTAVTEALVEGVAHTLKVWAEDDKTGKSVAVTRSFYVVPNRAPLLNVNTPAPTGSIDSDKFTISGNCSDLDGNEITVTRKINGASPAEIYKGQGADWNFEVSLAQLQIGQNMIVVEAVDSYGAKVAKTIKLQKDEIKTPVNTATARYKLTPPKGSATGVLLWVRRTETLQLDAKISMVLAGEQEQYFAPTDEVTTAQVSQGIVEDEFIFATAEAKTDIVLKLEMTKTHEDDAITLITGVFN